MNRDAGNKKSEFKRIAVFNKYTIVFLFVWFLLGVGASYAYY